MVSLYGCSGDNWRCVTRGTAMFSLNDKDEIDTPCDASLNFDRMHL